MACYHPIKAVVCGKNYYTGKNIIRFPKVYSDDPTGRCYLDGKVVPEDQIIYLPCGQCIGCRIQYSREWANRCMLELESHDSAYFITLTYDDDHVPLNWYSDPETGEAFQSMTLCKRDLQLFWKRLRAMFSEDHIRYFAAGEYGTKTFRPHYHAIVYGLHLDDLKPYKKSRDFGGKVFTYYNSVKLSACWTVDNGNDRRGKRTAEEKRYALEKVRPRGFVVVAPVSWETCAYVARYTTKKLKGKEAEFYSLHNMIPPFSAMSRSPGIAREWYDKHPGCHDYEYINLKTSAGGIKFRLPHYYDYLFDLENHDEMERIKLIRRKIVSDAQKIKLSQTDLSLDALLKVEEDNFTSKINTLRRDVL